MDVQHMLGDSVNALVKYFHSEKKIKSELAHLLCGERGLVCALEQVRYHIHNSHIYTLLGVPIR